MSPTHHHQQQRRNSVNTNSDSSEDGPWQCSTPLVRIFFYQVKLRFSKKISKCAVGTVNDVPGKYPWKDPVFLGYYCTKDDLTKLSFLKHY